MIRFQRRPLSSSTSTAIAALPLLPPSASSSLALLALSGAAAQAFQFHPLGARLSSPLAAMLLGGFAAAAFPNLFSSSSSSALSSAVSGTLVPLAACLALLEIDDGFAGGDGDGAASVGAEKGEERKAPDTKENRMDPTLAVSLSFALAALATVAATLATVFLCLGAPLFFPSSSSSSSASSSASSFLFFLPAESALPRPLLIKVAACLCASYVGGSVNFTATATALGLSSSAEGARAMAAAFAADLVAMALYFGALAALRVPKGEEEWARGGGGGGSGGGGFDIPFEDSSSSSSSSPSSSVSTLSAALSLAAASCSGALGELVSGALGCPRRRSPSPPWSPRPLAMPAGRRRGGRG